MDTKKVSEKETDYAHKDLPSRAKNNTGLASTNSETEAKVAKISENWENLSKKNGERNCLTLREITMKWLMNFKTLEIKSVRNVLLKIYTEWYHIVNCYMLRKKIQPILTQQRMNVADVEKIGWIWKMLQMW